jgi:ABC-2 type transport system permease protein
MAASADPAPFYQLLLRSWRQQLRNRFHQMVHQSRLMMAVIGVFIVGYWISFTWMFHRGIYFVQHEVPGLGDLLLARMFYMLFAIIFFMLITSSAIVGYGVLYRNRETAWLQTLPIPHNQLFRWKFLELAFMASWAFLFLSGPLFLAYGLALKLPLTFYLGVALLYLPFSLLANLIGTFLMLLLVRTWHTSWGRKVITVGTCLAIVGAYWLFKPVDVETIRTEVEIVPLMNVLLKNTRLVVSPMLPSYWLSSAVIGVAENLWMKALFFFLLILSYLVLCGWFILRYSGGLFYDNASRVQDRRLHGKAHTLKTFVSPVLKIGSVLLLPLFWLKKPVRSILLKDWMLFWRDTAQWSQFAIFFGLLGFYFLNIRNFRHQLDERFWVSVVAFLNLTSIALILSTLTTRFIFPQFSLEGRRLWLIGLAPFRLSQVIWGKFWASAFINGVVTLILISFSFASLRLDPGLRWIIGFTIGMMSFGLSGIAVGTGVLFPNLKGQNAAQVVSGFGGTFCLVVSLAYVAILVLVVAMPMHLRYMARLSLEFRFTSSVGVIYTIAFVVSLLAAFLPMFLATQKLKKFEI